MGRRNRHRFGGAVASASSRRGFTLIELLVVIAAFALLMVLIVPAFSQLDAARRTANAAYAISGALDTARAYAKANNTYAWVGFFEEGADGAAGTAGTGRVIVSTVASRDATCLYNSTDADPSPLNAASLIQLGKLVKLEGIHLAVLAPVDIPARGRVANSTGSPTNVSSGYQVGDTDPPAADNFTRRGTVTNRTVFTYPVNTAAPIYRFVKIIQFDPGGDATKIVDSPVPLMEIALRPTHRGVIDAASKNCVAIQVAGIGGQVRVYRP